MILNALRSAETYRKYSDFVNVKLLSPTAHFLFKEFGAYFEKEKKDLTISQLEAWVYHYKYPDLPKSKKKELDFIFTALSECKEELPETVIIRWQAEAMKAELLAAWESGDSDLLHDLMKRRSEFQQEEEGGKEPFVPSEVIKALDKIRGVSWPLKCLNDAVGPLLTGDMIGVAACVGGGKTAFAITCATHFARQGKRVLYLNNEEGSQQIMLKFIMCALHKSQKECEIVQDIDAAYNKALDGHAELISYRSIHGWTISKVEKLISKEPCDIIVLDQIDNVFGGGASESAEYLRLDKLWYRVRHIANTIAPVIGLTQLDASATWIDEKTGEMRYSKYPGMRQLSGSKIGKPAQVDVLLTIGKDNYAPNVRGISIAKTKRVGNVPSMKDGRFDVNFDPISLRYFDPVVL